MFFSTLLILVALIGAVEDCKTVFLNEFHYDSFFRDSQITEFVEIAGPVGTSLDGWQIMTFHGSTQTVCGNGVCEDGWEKYNDKNGHEVINCFRDCVPGYPKWVFNETHVIPQMDNDTETDIGNGWGVIVQRFGTFLTPTEIVEDLPDGFADGILLVNAEGEVVQMVTYEGDLQGQTAFTSPPLDTADIPTVLTELSSLYLYQLNAVSIQLQGSGFCLKDFTWEGPGTSTKGVNTLKSEGAINFDQYFYTFPSVSPSVIPSVSPSVFPSTSPSVLPSSNPSTNPTVLPSHLPSTLPTNGPSGAPSTLPTCSPSTLPSTCPSTSPSVLPTTSPSVDPSVNPSTAPSSQPSVVPTTFPSVAPSVVPSSGPSVNPTTEPSKAPITSLPSTSPSAQPTVMPSVLPSTSPSTLPSVSPSTDPTVLPTGSPSVLPTVGPTTFPSTTPSVEPSVDPTTAPSFGPSAPPVTSGPSVCPTTMPSLKPFLRPTALPSVCPSGAPSVGPTTFPSYKPSVLPTAGPSVIPSTSPSFVPSVIPSCGPSTSPTVLPSVSPSVDPTTMPSVGPTVLPTVGPSTSPSVCPSVGPTTCPSTFPSVDPSTAPSTSPSVLPTVGPSVDPTTFPSYTPSVVPSAGPSISPTIEACATALHRKVGSNLIVLNKTESSWDDTNDEFTFAVHLPFKYTADSIEFEGASDTSNNYASSNAGSWSYEYRANDCMHVFTITVDFDNIKDGAIVTQSSGNYYYTGSLKVVASETFNHDIDPTQVYTRQLVQDLVWILQIEDSVELSIDVVDVYINDASVFHVFTKYAVLEHDGTSSQVTVRYQTEVNYPWVLNSTNYDFVDESPYGIPYTSKGALTENSKTNCGTGNDGKVCVQELEVVFPVSDVCSILGNWTVRHYATYEGETQSFDFTAIVSLDSICATTITNVEGQASLTSYSSNVFDTLSNKFQIGSTAYFKLVVDDTIQSVNSIVLSSVEVENMNNTYTCTSDNGLLGFTEIALTATECTFSMDIEVDKIKGDETAAVRANVVVDYTDRRRSLLTIDLGDARRALIDHETGKRLLMYVDKDNKVEVEHIIMITETVNQDHVGCSGDDGIVYDHNTIYEVACHQGSTSKLIKQCEEGVWEPVLNQCGISVESENLTSESLNTESNSINWETIFFILIGVTVLGVLFVGARKMCHAKVTKRGESLTPKKTTKPVLLDIQHETNC